MTLFRPLIRLIRRRDFSLSITAALFVGTSQSLRAREPAPPIKPAPPAPSTAQWHTVTSTEAAFSVRFPGRYETKHEEKDDKETGKNSLTVTIQTPGFDKSKEPFIYSCIVTRVNKANMAELQQATPEGKDPFRDIVLPELSKSLRPPDGSPEAKAIKSDRSFSWDGLAAREWYMSSDKGGKHRAARFRVLAGPGKIIALIVLAQSPRPIPASALTSADKFFDSLRLSDMPASFDAAPSTPKTPEQPVPTTPTKPTVPPANPTPPTQP